MKDKKTANYTNKMCCNLSGVMLLLTALMMIFCTALDGVLAEVIGE